MDDPLNAGLDWIVPQIDDLYDSTFPYGPDAKVMSRADFWSLAGIVAVDYSIDIANIDCPELCPKPVSHTERSSMMPPHLSTYSVLRTLLQ